MSLDNIIAHCYLKIQRLAAIFLVQGGQPLLQQVCCQVFAKFVIQAHISPKQVTQREELILQYRLIHKGIDSVLIDD